MSSVNKKLTTMLQLSANVNTLNLTYIFTKEDALRMDTFEAANKDVNALKRFNTKVLVGLTYLYLTFSLHIETAKQQISLKLKSFASAFQVFCPREQNSYIV